MEVHCFLAFSSGLIPPASLDNTTPLACATTCVAPPLTGMVPPMSKNAQKTYLGIFLIKIMHGQSVKVHLKLRKNKKHSGLNCRQGLLIGRTFDRHGILKGSVLPRSDQAMWEK